MIYKHIYIYVAYFDLPRYTRARHAIGATSIYQSD